MKMVTSRLSLFLFATSLSVSAHSEALYFIDAHSQADQDIALENIVELMKDAGVKQTILAARGKRDSFDIADLAEEYPDQVIAAVRTKSKHYIRNTNKYYKLLKQQLDSGRFHAMAELLLYHAQKGDRADEVIVYPDDARVTAAFEAASKHGWPVILHIEFAALRGDQREKYFTALERFLDEHPEHPVALIHMGQLSAVDVKMLIDKHANLYFLMSHCNPVSIEGTSQPWVNMFKDGVLAPEWESLVVSNYSRFIFALDNVWPEQWRNGYKEQVQLWRKALAKLPVEAANAVAHGNAESLWKLQ